MGGRHGEIVAGEARGKIGRLIGMKFGRVFLIEQFEKGRGSTIKRTEH
jgi:hypothetical protein